MQSRLAVSNCLAAKRLVSDFFIKFVNLIDFINSFIKIIIMKNLLLIISLFLFGTINAQEPAWVNFTKRQSLFPYENYYTGFSACRKDKNKSVDDLLERLKKNATDELGNSVQVTVESVSTMNIIDATDDFFQSFKHSSTSFSKVDLIGMETETYYDKKKKTGFAFVYVKKNDLIVYYQNMIVWMRSFIW